MAASPKPWKTRRLSGAKLVIVGCGDVGLRLLAQLNPKIKCVVLGRNNAIVKAAHPSTPCITVDLDHRQSRLTNQTSHRKLSALAPWVIYLAPPPAIGLNDPRVQRFAAQFGNAQCCVYVSTTAVYGSLQGEQKGAWVTETSPLIPTEARGKRRLAAEQCFKRSAIAKLSVLRAPGIYARDRLPIERIRQRLPTFTPADDVPTNHIHADDLARLCWLGLFRGGNRRAYNAADGHPMLHGEYLNAVADTFGLSAPPRLPALEVKNALSPTAWSMLSAARRISSQRLMDEWRITLQHPSMAAFLARMKP